MTKKIALILMSFIIFIYPVVNANPQIESSSVVLMEAETGKVIFGKDSDKQYYPASITKILTAIIAIEETDLQETVTISEDVPFSITPNSSAIYLLTDEELTVEQLLYALLVESANDAAVALAKHISGSVEGFSILMNQKANSLGATHSNFITPNGLHDENHYVTAYDMALIMREAIKYPILKEMMTTVNYVIPATEKQITRYLWTKNKMLKVPSNKYYYDGVIASKTGYTTEARYTLVTASQENDMELIAVALNGTSSSVYTDTLNLFEYGFNNFKTGILVHKGDLIQNYEMEHTNTPLKILSKESIPYVISANSSDNITKNIKLSKDLSLPVKENQRVGVIEYILNNEVIGEADLIAGNSIESNLSRFVNKMKTILLWAFVLLFGLYIIARIVVLALNTKIKIKRKRIQRKSKNEYSGF